MAEIGKDIERAASLLRQGELVAIPTETVYGLAGNALDTSAVTKIFSVKNRPQFDPLIVHVSDTDHAQSLVTGIPREGLLLARQFWPGPLALVLKKKQVIPDLVTAGLDSVGIRCPNHSLTRELLTILSFPVAAPSANPFGFTSPTRPEHVDEQLGDRISYILDGGTCKIGLESTIVGFEERPVVYRLGGVAVEDIESVVGKVGVRTHSTSNPLSPGQLDSHYSPGKKLILGNIESLQKQYKTSNVGLLSFQKNYQAPHQFIMSPEGNIEVAAQNLFVALRTLGKMDIDIIIAEEVPDIGLGRAINDRLRRAAAK